MKDILASRSFAIRCANPFHLSNFARLQCKKVRSREILREHASRMYFTRDPCLRVFFCNEHEIVLINVTRKINCSLSVILHSVLL